MYIGRNWDPNMPKLTEEERRAFFENEYRKAIQNTMLFALRESLVILEMTISPTKFDILYPKAEGKSQIEKIPGVFNRAGDEVSVQINRGPK